MEVALLIALAILRLCGTVNEPIVAPSANGPPKDATCEVTEALLFSCQQAASAVCSPGGVNSAYSYRPRLFARGQAQVAEGVSSTNIDRFAARKHCRLCNDDWHGSILVSKLP